MDGCDSLSRKETGVLWIVPQGTGLRARYEREREREKERERERNGRYLRHMQIYNTF